MGNPSATRVVPMRQGPSTILSAGFEGADNVEVSTTGQRYRIQVPRSDIERCIRFSTWRCIVTIIGVALVLTDIPRTGLSLSLEKMYPRVAPGVYSSYGPYAYPTIFINRSSASIYEGLRKGKPMAAANVWAYKFDTLSISQRAIAEHLHVAAYPDCILYREPCPSTTLSLATTFGMIDGWVSAMQARYFSTSTLPFVFMTRNNWLDRLHHILIKAAWRRQDARVHTVRFFSSAVANSTTNQWRLCALPSSSRHRRVQRAYVCDFPVKWRFSHPLPLKDGSKPKAVSIPTHIELRFRALQRQFPQLSLDLTMITTRSILTSEPVRSSLPIVFYTTENVEVTTWIRGRQCRNEANGIKICETVFVDDYRYEGATLTTNVEDWKTVTAVLRAIAQGYIWLRVGFLCIGAFLARSSEPKYQGRSIQRRVFAALAAVSRIPSHTIVYGSWLPICCYSLAHVIDSGLTHLISNNVWSAIDGLFKFQFVAYISSATVQMRNVWMLALVGKLVMAFYTNTHAKSRGDPWLPTNGVLAVRGIFVSFVSWLTVFSFLRALRFRDTNVISFVAFPRHVPFNGLRFTPQYSNVADFGYRLDVKTCLIATLLLGSFVQVLQFVVARTTNRRTRYIFCRSYYVPLSTGTLWSPAKLSMFWSLRLNKTSDRTASVSTLSTLSRSRIASMQALKTLSALALEQTVLPSTPSPHIQCTVCNRPLSLVHWRSVQGCVRHDHLFRAESRQQETWSMVRLINLTMLSDPIVLVEMYVFGKELQLCRPHDKRRDHLQQPALLLPALRNETTRLQCVGYINSKAVPWNLLVNCG